MVARADDDVGPRLLAVKGSMVTALVIGLIVLGAVARLLRVWWIQNAWRREYQRRLREQPLILRRSSSS